MISIHHTCDDCSSEFTIKYNEEVCETDPLHCPFCASYLLEAEEYDDEDD